MTRPRAAGQPPAGDEAVESLIIFADGACRGNPGQAAAGALLTTPAGDTVQEVACTIGHATNNVAEYRSLILGLEAALEHGASQVTVRMDSELVVRQVTGRYRVKNPALKLLHQEAEKLRRKFRRFTIEHIPRAKNAEADRLANEALDREAD